MMPGFFSPARNTIFNEKTFRFASFCTPDQTPVFDQDEEALLDLRSTYGPFTCRLPSCRIDQKLYLTSLKNEAGVAVSYLDAAKNDPPEFIRLYFDWLEQEKKVSVHDTVHIGIFSHAANGGIKIDPDGFTGVKGLYACGEVTGGMHGADRIGGLSTANGLVFGQRAGRAAANAASTCTGSHTPDVYDFSEWSIPDRSVLRKELQDLMYRNVMIIRNEPGLSTTLMMLHELLHSSPRIPDTDVSAITDSRILEGQFLTAICVLKAALLRKESRGSHYREDYPNIDPNMAYPIQLSLQDQVINVLLP